MKARIVLIAFIIIAILLVVLAYIVMEPEVKGIPPYEQNIEHSTTEPIVWPYLL